MTSPAQSEGYTSALSPSADPYTQLDLFDNTQFYQHFDDHFGLEPRQYTSQETGAPVYGKYAQDGFWDDESDSHTVRQRASTSTAHTVVPKSPASSRRPPSSKADHSSLRSPSTAVSSPRTEYRGESRAELRPEDRENQKGTFRWGKKPSMANLQAPQLHPNSMEGDYPQAKEPAIQKKKSFGLFKSMAKRTEPVVDVADESFEAGPPPSTPSTCRSMRSDPRSSLVNRSRIPSAPNPAVVRPDEVPAETETKTRQSGWKRGMNKLFKAKSFNTLRTAEPVLGVKPPAARPQAHGVENDVPPVPTLPLNVQKRNVAVQSTHGLNGPTPPPSSTRSDFPTSSRTRRPSGLKKENSNSNKPETRQPNSNSVYSLLMSPPPSARSASFALDSHPSLPLDPFASSLNASANTLPVSPSLSDFQPSTSRRQQQQSPQHHTLPARPKLPRHSPSLKDFKSLLQGGNKQKLAKTKSLANLSGRYKENTSPIDELPSKDNRADRSLNSIHTELDGPPSIHQHQSSTAPVESPPLVPPKPPYFPTISHTGRLDSSLPGSHSTSTPSSPLTPPPTSPLPPLPPSASPTVSSPTVGPSHTIPLASGGEASSTPPTRSGSGAVLLPRSRSTSMSLKAPPTSSSFFDLYEQLGIWPTPEKKEAEEEAQKGGKAEPRSPLETKTTLTTSISDLASKLEPAAQAPSQTASTPVSASPSATFSSASWQAKLDAFPLVDGNSSVEAVADMSMDFDLPYINDSLQITESPPQMPLEVDVDSLTPEDAVEGQRERARSTSDGQGVSHAHQSSSRRSQATGLGFLDMRETTRNLSRNSSGSRRSSRDRRSRRNTRDTYWDSASSQEDDSEDDVPLSQLHPEAQAKRKADAARRASRKAAKAARAAQRDAVHSTRLALEAKKPGGSTKWNGEGGVPADLLAHKLSALQVRSEPLSQHPLMPPASLAPQASSSRKPRPAPLDSHAIRPQRSYTGPIADHHVVGSPAVQRSLTTRVSGKDERHPRSPVQYMAPAQTAMQAKSSSGQHLGSLQPSPMMNYSPTLPSPAATHHSESSSSRTSARVPQSPHVPPSSRGQDMSRNDTIASRRSRQSTDERQRGSSANETGAKVPPPRSPVSLSRKPSERQPRGRARLLSVLIEGTSRRMDVDVYTDTNVGAVLSRAYEELGTPSQKHSWVLCEAFGELGCERRLREYEEIMPVINGWDPVSTNNALILRTSHNVIQATARGIPNAPPMIGSWIQYETKKGKWSKRWLETRGGQVFMSKNEKYKDEHQINTLFHDVFLMAKDYKAPFPYAMVIKRNEPAKTFENPDEYMHVFSSDEATLHKLANAIYDSKSFNLANTYPRLLVNHDERRRIEIHTQSSHPARALSIRRAEGAENKPLIELVPGQLKETGFTGKGLLAGRSRPAI